MTADLRNISVWAYGNGLTQYHYSGHGTALEDILQDGFFDTATMFGAGDHIVVSANDGGAILYILPGGRVVTLSRTPPTTA